MPNEIYQHTYKRLAGLVSSRAAGQTLRNALDSRKESSETIQVKSMIRLIKGPIFREFQLILPREGLKRTLNDLISELRKFDTEPDESVSPSDTLSSVATSNPEPTISLAQPAVTTPDRTKITLIDEDIVLDEVDPSLDAGLDDLLAADDDLDSVEGMLLFGDDDSPSVSEDVADTDVFLIEDESREVAQGATTETIVSESPSLAQQDVQDQPVLSSDKLEEIVLKFAQIEQITQVVAMRQRGQIEASRGEGIDLQHLSSLGLMAIRLLERSGQLCSYYLSHSAGQIFLLPVLRDIIVVAGTPALNVGEVFSTHVNIKKMMHNHS